jgi:hypothetical protein
MMTPSEHAYVATHAYVPEHLPHYVSAISGSNPFLIGDFVTHMVGARLVFVGYPLSGTASDAQVLEALDEAKARLMPTVVSLIAPALPAGLNTCAPSPPDAYYRLDLSQLLISQKTRNMLTRARREVSVSIGRMGAEHQRLIEDFLCTRQLDGTRFIVRRLPEYAKCATALVLDARTPRGELVAFDVAEFGAQHYAFHMFNFRAHHHNTPGACDLLLAHIVERAQAEGKSYLNLGLGINAGVAFFKTKWGATPFLQHIHCVQEGLPQKPWHRLLDFFLGRPAHHCNPRPDPPR